MKLYWAPQTRSARALWMLEELGVDYEREHVDIRDPGRRDSDDFRVASPLVCVSKAQRAPDKRDNA